MYLVIALCLRRASSSHRPVWWYFQNLQHIVLSFTLQLMGTEYKDGRLAVRRLEARQAQQLSRLILSLSYFR